MKKVIIVLVFFMSIKMYAQEDYCAIPNPEVLVSPTALYKSNLSLNIPVVFHVIISSNNEGDVLNSQLTAQINKLNTSFSNGNISFYLAGINRIINDSWRNLPVYSYTFGPNPKEVEMKNALAIDINHVLNIYITSITPVKYRGWATYPWDNWINNYPLLPGVVITPDILPGGSDPNNNLGGVTVHETGHYFGLYHTFHEFICHTYDPDLVSDTKIHLPNSGCPDPNEIPSTCEEGPDPIDNYMNYAYDPCRYRFTNGQFVRMNKMIQQYRSNLGGSIINFTKDLTIAVGNSFNFFQGIMKFSTGKKLIVNGTLNVNGTSGNLVAFDRNGSSGTWGGIQFNNGASGNINYANIKNASQGINLNETGAVSVSNSEISNCSGHGIYIYRTNYATQPTISKCKIHDNSSSSGIVMYWSSPDITGCEVYNNFNGLGIADYSSPRLGYTYVYGNNNIHNNSNIGVFSLRYSNPLLGRALTPFQAGNNIIASNSFRDAQAETYCYIYAENNWWGSNPPISNKIVAISGSTINYIPYLTAVPTQSMAVPYFEYEIAKSLNVGNTNIISNITSINQDLTSDDPESAYSIYLLNNLWNEASKSDLKSFKTYLKELADKKDRKVLYAAAKLILSGYEKENRIKMIDEVISDYDGMPISETALMNKFLFYFNESQDYEMAKNVIKEMVSKTPNSSTINEAKKHFEINFPLLQTSNRISLNKEQNSEDVIFAHNYSLIGNYPNPFNPTTLINYTIPVNSIVKISIYDIMGSLIKSFDFNSQSSGYHKVEWDGTNETGIKVSSGTYIYRMEAVSTEGNAERFVQSKKMILIK